MNIVLIGNPNVGKSLLFYLLTGKYATVSNYPGTTVEVRKGKAYFNGCPAWVYDTPGMYSLFPATEEEQVARKLLLDISPDLIIHVAEAKNLPRMLPLTLDIISCGFPVVLVLNMLDEAAKAGVTVDSKTLSSKLGIPVLGASFISGMGLDSLRKTVRLIAKGEITASSSFPDLPEVDVMSKYLEGEYPLRRQAVSRLFMSGDEEITSMMEKEEGIKALKLCHKIKMSLAGKEHSDKFFLYTQRRAEKILKGVFNPGRTGKTGFLEWLTLHPAGGMAILALVLYAGLYLLVGRVGAGFLVDLLEKTFLAGIILPLVEGWVASLVTWYPLKELLTGKYGVFTLGLRYAVGIILPVVTMFFFFFALLEDSGYLPRLAYQADRFMSFFGLNGRAVIPLVLGFGCGTMAVLVTRTLESKRERLICTFLLALAVPCSAQLGLIAAMLAVEPTVLLSWFLIVGGWFLTTGIIMDKMLPGVRAPFVMEMTPLRLPKPGAVLQKTKTRVWWYLQEIVPVFLMVSVLIWALDRLGGLDVISEKISVMLGLMGLPPTLAIPFLYGFFRRDYGAAGLFDLYRTGSLDAAQLLIAACVLTLFLPCLAQVVVMFRERGPRDSFLACAFVLLAATGTGIILRILLGLPAL